jgi:aminoglycoside 6'-N-acetyltransferase
VPPRLVTVTLRRAAPADAELLRSWDDQPHVIAASGEDDACDWDLELARTVPWREQLMIEVDGRPVGVIQIIDPRNEETHYWGDVPAGLRAIDVWLGSPDDLGRGYGTAGMRLAVDRCFADPEVTAILIDPLERNTRARAFYRRLGFRDAGLRTFGSDVCMVMRLDRPGAGA